MSKKLKLWSIRWSAAKGNHFRYERDVTEDDAKEWLKIFQADEPDVLFIVSAKKPK